MANNIEMITFAGQTVTPLDDALIYGKALSNGILYGCNVSLSGGNTIHIEGGHGIICGRKFTIFESDIPVPLSSGSTLNGRLKIHMDLSDTGQPIQLIVESAASLPALEQDEDANINNGVYEFNIATFNVTTSAVTNFKQVFPVADVNTADMIANNMTTPETVKGKALDARQGNPAIAGTLAALVAAKVAKTDIVNNGATAEDVSGKVLDARQGNPAIAGSMAAQINTLNNRLQTVLPPAVSVSGKTYAEHLQLQHDAGNLPIGAPFLIAVNFYEKGVKVAIGYLYISSGKTYGNILVVSNALLVDVVFTNGVATQTEFTN